MITSAPENFDTQDHSPAVEQASQFSKSGESCVLQERAETLLRELVTIDSSTTNFLGVTHAQRRIEAELFSMGFSTRLIASPMDHATSFLVAELRGQHADFITFVSHSDTVLANDAFSTPFRVDAITGRAYGSGVIDNKGGVVVLLEGLRKYLSSLVGEKPHFSLRVLISPNEEAGSAGFLDLYASFAESSACVLGFEPALENGSIIESRRGNRWYQIHIRGREAHAGRCRGEQVNAAHELAMKIVKLHELHRPEEGVAVNIAQIEGGRDRFNVVCGEARAKLDVRFASFASRDALHSEIERIFSTSHVPRANDGLEASCRYTIDDDCPPFSRTNASRKAIDFYLRTIEEIEGTRPQAEKAGGAGDVNYMSKANIAVLDGLGPVGGGMHTTDEFIVLSSLSTRAQALAEFLSHAPGLLAQDSGIDYF